MNKYDIIAQTGPESGFKKMVARTIHRLNLRRKEESMKIIIASSNNHKIKEIAARCTDIPIAEFVSVKDILQMDEIDENGSTFEENSMIKARAVRDATGMISLADDSGLVIDALGGEPGIYSARYGNLSSDAERNALVLSNLSGVEPALRTARFVCVLSLAFPGGKEYNVRGECEGSVLESPRGNGGFGYDPIFLLPNGKTMAELSLEEKNTISHRAVALDKLHSLLLDIL